MNSINCIIQILEIPTIELYNNTIPMVQFRVQLPYPRNKVQSAIIVESIIWGDLAYDIVNYYRINDYALVEGYVTTLSKNSSTPAAIKLNIIRLYPFLFALQENN